MPIRDFDPVQHGRFVFGSWCAGSGEPREVLAAHLGAGARCLVYVGKSDPNLLIGWAAVVPGTSPPEVVWAYCKWDPKGLPRGRGVMTALLAELGVDTTAPMVALYDSPACQGLRRKGWPIIVKGPHERTENRQAQ